MKRLILILVMLPLFSFSQGIDNLWMMGYENFSGPPFGGINLDFSSGAPVISYHLRQINYGDISVTICDSTGNFLFTTNGVYLTNSTGDTMLNGSGLSPSYYTTAVADYGLYVPQTALAIPDPASPTKYYLFHNTVDDSVAYAYKMYYSKIDMSLDGGLGAVTNKNVVLINDTLVPGRLTATRHGNGRDWWVVFHQAHTNRYYIYIVDPSGVHLHSTQNIGVNMVFDKGQFCFSPDGSRFAQYGASNDLDIMDFDRCNGVLSNCVHISINDSAVGAGIAFSPNSSVLYATSTSYVYQFDLTASNISSTKATVAVWDTFYSPSPPFATTFYLEQLAPDGKIYISCTNGTLDIHSIDNPDSLGMACNVCQHCVHLPAYDGFTIPNMPNYHLGSLAGSQCDTLTAGVEAISDKNMSVNLFPNPAREKLYASFTLDETPTQWKIYNAIGERCSVSSNVLNHGEYIEFDLSALPVGIYFVEFDFKDQKVVKKLVRE